MTMIFNHAARNRLIDLNPAEHVEKITPDVASGTSRIDSNILTGARQGEILGAQWTELDFDTGLLHICRSWKDGAYHAPKTKTSNRRITLPKSLIVKLKAWKLACPNGVDGLIFPNQVGLPISHGKMSFGSAACSATPRRRSR